MNTLKSKIRSLCFVSLIPLLTCASLTVNAQSLSSLTKLYDFSGFSDGKFPQCPLVQGTDGWFYGTTTEGGPRYNSQSPSAAGTVFRISSSGVMQQLYYFPEVPWPGGPDLWWAPSGQGPEVAGGLVQGSDGNFYGTTAQGGSYSQDTNDVNEVAGTLFEIDTSGNLTTLWNFSGDTVTNDSGAPRTTLASGNDGYLYGTTSGVDGTQIGGTIFKFYPSPSTRQIATLYTFTGGSDGNVPSGLVLGKDGNFYGTTAIGGQHGYGTLFKFTPGGTFTTLYSFNGTDGNMNASIGQNGLIQGSDGYFYGTTPSGGPSYDGGTLFRFNTTNNTLTTLYNFTGGFDGGVPRALIQANDGNFYGQCVWGGWGDYGNAGTSWGYGTVFVFTPNNGHLITIYAFSGADGYNPEAGLVQGSDGNLYGTTMDGGVNGGLYPSGTIFKILPVGHRWGDTNTVTTANSGTWTCPSNIYYATIECWGAGGGGGSATTYSPSGGGGGGAYSKGNIVQTVPGYQYQNLVGVHGNADSSGGNTAFPNLSGGNSVEALGGAQGTLTAGGLGGQASAGIGDVKFSGGNGAAGTYSGPYIPTWSGPGGGGAGSTGSGGNAPPGYNSTGGSGTSLYGGNGGNGWETYQGYVQNSATAGASYGGGGAGAIYTTWPATSGADGLMQISY